MTQPFLPSPDGPVPNPLPPPPPPDPLLAAVVLAKLSPADRAALLEQALSARYAGPRPLTVVRSIADPHGAARAAVTAGVGPAQCRCARGPEPCNSPTFAGPCALRLGHPVGPEMPGGGHLP